MRDLHATGSLHPGHTWVQLGYYTQVRSGYHTGRPLQLSSRKIMHSVAHAMYQCIGPFPHESRMTKCVISMQLGDYTQVRSCCHTLDPYSFRPVR